MLKTHIYENIEGWFDFPILYKLAVERSNNNSHFVEIGSWMGKSASFLAVEIINCNKNIKFDCIDTWNGSDEHNGFDILNQEDKLYNTFKDNIKTLNHIINPVRMNSIDASKLYEDNSLDFVFIDAAHDYNNVKLDIQNWYPKVKTGGLFAGHDYTPAWQGVIDAVNEFASELNYNINRTDVSAWHVIKKV
jgi:predicted O-methyltransferase YrrM